MNLVVKNRLFFRSEGRAQYCAALSLALGMSAQTALAQDPPPVETAPPAETGAAVTTDGVSPEPIQASPDSTTPPPESTAPPEEPVTAESAVEPPAEAPGPFTFAPTFTVGVGARSGLDLNLGTGTLSLSDGLVDQLQVRPFMSGSLTPNVGFFVQFEIGSGSGAAGSQSFLPAFQILDAVAQLKVVNEFQVWVGQHIPANDRNNMNGPFFGNTWNFATVAGSYPFDVGARDRGITAWGLIAGGHVKYHISAVDLQPGRDIAQARLAGRLTLHFLEPENFYYNSGTYWGKQDILTVGGVFHTQKGSDAVLDDDLMGFSFDGMFEKTLGKAGTFTAEAGYFNFDSTGANYVGNQYSADSGTGVSGPYPGEGMLALVSWLTPDSVGPGKIQPNARVQYGDYAGTKTTMVDIGLAYVIDGYNHKYHLNYRHGDTTDPMGVNTKLDSIQVGFQYMMAK